MPAMARPTECRQTHKTPAPRGLGFFMSVSVDAPSQAICYNLNIMKKIIYIALCVILGFLLGFLVHAAIEILMINLLVSNFRAYSLGLNWDAWFLVHSIGTFVLFVLGGLGGYFLGKHWWRIVYVERRWRGFWHKK